MFDAAPFAALLATAAGTAVLHTLAGPDHYVPLLAAARAHGWRTRTTLWVTALAGLVHCATSLALVPVVLWLGRDLAGLQAARGDFAGWLLLGLGLALLFAAARRLRRGETAPVRGVRGALLLAFAVGPCEWLLPNALAATATVGIGGALAVSALFAAVTTLTMVAAVAFGLRVVPASLASARWAQLLPGAALSICGALVLAGW